MADWTHLQPGDDVDAATFGGFVGASNLGDHVEYGLRFQAVDWSAGTFNVTEGKAFIVLDEQYATNENQYRQRSLFTAHLDPRSGVTFDTGAVNYVYLNFNAGTDDSPRLEIESTELATDDWLKIAEIDPSQPVDQRITRFNDAPAGTFADIETDTISVSESIIYPDGEERSGAPLTANSVLNNRNEFYDADAISPPGVVAEAEHAQTADSATSADAADSATTAARAERAEEVGTLSQTDIESLIENSSGEWTRLETLTDANANEPFDVNWRASDVYDRYLVTLYLENHHDGRVHADLTVNGHDRANYFQTKALPEAYSRVPAIQTYQSRTHWEVGEALPHAMSVEEFELACPRAVVAPRNHWPTMGVHSQATNANTSLEMAGHITKSMSTISSFQLSTTADATGRIVVKGQNLSQQ